MPKQPPATSPGSEDPSEGLDELLEHFELAWRNGIPPVLEEFLAIGRAPWRPLLHELVKIDLEYRWRGPGQSGSSPNGGGSWPAQPRLEDYVERLGRLGPLSQLPVDLIGEEYRVRQRWGDRPDHAEYAARFPGHGEALRAELVQIDIALAVESGQDTVPPPFPPEVVHLRCPHCHQSLEVAGELLLLNFTCPACSGTFSVEALSPAPARAEQPRIRRLGRYALGELLGTGAFGSVWQARDTELAREVAVKLPRSGQFVSAAEEERFLREARSAAQLQHPGIVVVHDVGREGETLYIVSELVRGVSLTEWLRYGRLSFVEAAELLAQVADALDYAHRQGVVHRDVKPSNIMLELDQKPVGTVVPGREHRPPVRRPRVMDFGLALRDVGEVTITLDGQVLGTPAYMSPEQVRNPHAVDGRSDVYSLGVILYELLTGELPFRGLTRMLLLQVLSDEPRPPRRLNDRIPRDLETICLKCLAKEPNQRYRTAGALAADLRHWLRGEPIRARPVSRAEWLWLWLRRNPALAATTGLGVVALVALTGAPAAAVLVALAVGSLLLALYKVKAAAELAQTVEGLKQDLRKTAAALQFAIKHYSLAHAERQRAVAAESQATRRFAPARELARAVLFDLPDRIADPAGPAPARAFLVRTVLAYLEGLAREAGNDPLLLRELAVAYARVGDVQGSPDQGIRGDVAGALASYRKSQEIFALLARAYPDNAQAQHDLAVSRGKVAGLQRALGQARRSGRPWGRGNQGGGGG